ncbi:MAG: Rab family GTPase [Candidatus Thorarchaeota archaeon]
MVEGKFIFDTNILTVKVVVAGPGGVGKTTLLKRYETNHYIPAVSTVGVNFLIMDQEVGDHLLRVAYWDYAGENRFRSLFPGYCQGSAATILCFDISRIKTLQELPEWLNMARAHNQGDMPVILVGNKIDTLSGNADLISEAANRFVKEFNISGYYLTSAKSGTGMEAPFAHLGILILEAMRKRGEIT